MEFGSSRPMFLSLKNKSYLILLFILVRVSNALVGPRFIVTEPGGSLNFTCQYTMSRENIHGRKYWCKISNTNSECSTVISSTKYVAADYKGRVRLVDSPSIGAFQVEMTQLKPEDAGWYRYGIGQNKHGVFFNVFLALSGGPNTTDQLEVVHGMLRGSVTIRCRFNESITDKMYWCKMQRTGGCRIIADTEGYVEQEYKGRILIVPGVKPNLFKILINELLEEDAGWYRCGIGAFNNHRRWKDIQMHISKDSKLPEMTTILYRPQGGSVAIECHKDTQLKNGDKYLCKWKPKECTRLIDIAGFVDEASVGRLSRVAGEEDSTTYTILMTDLRTEDSGWYWCIAVNGSNDITSSIELRISQGGDCKIPGKLLNGEVQFQARLGGRTDTKFGSLEIFVCNTGFILVGRNRRMCTASGWNDAVPNCEAVICPKPPDIPNGTYTSMGQEEFRYQNGVTYSCNSKEFSLIGKASIYCTADGDWSGPTPKCKGITIFYSTNTTPRANTAVIFLTDSRGHNESLYQEKTVPGLYENPQREDSAPDLHAHSNHTIFRDGWKTNDNNLLLFVVPSVVLVLLLLLGAGAIIAIKARRRLKYRVRKPVSTNESHVAMAETRCLQEGAGPGSPSMCGDEETEVDLPDVSTGLIDKATVTSFTADT